MEIIPQKITKIYIADFYGPGVDSAPKARDTLSLRHVSSHKTCILFSTPSLSLPMRWLSYAELYNLVTWCHMKRSVGALFQ